jgi:hypothetical protein
MSTQGPPSRCGYMSVLLPAGTPDEQLLPFIRQRVTDALVATGEWPVRIEIVPRQRQQDGVMKRWFVEYETGPFDPTLQASA